MLFSTAILIVSDRKSDCFRMKSLLFSDKKSLVCPTEVEQKTKSFARINQWKFVMRCSIDYCEKIFSNLEASRTLPRNNRFSKRLDCKSVRMTICHWLRNILVRCSGKRLFRHGFFIFFGKIILFFNTDYQFLIYKFLSWAYCAEFYLRSMHSGLLKRMGKWKSRVV